MRRFKGSSRNAVLVIACVIGGVVGAMLGPRMTERSVCLDALDGQTPPWRMIRDQEYCISLVDPFVPEPNPQELSVPPRLLSDPRDAVRRLQPRVEALESHVDGTATVRFQLTGEGIVRNPRVVASSGNAALDEAIASVATSFEFSPASTASGLAEVPMEYVVGFDNRPRARLLRWLSAIDG